ncbi:phage integrase SAM-like domain-containing protein [Fibrella forsythiae]|uniref:phage integrase SAM-like domain-containing protein n=1 Tax=Fibrella forsythiae TaxID=2817061 RepID=UPI001E43AA05|nr:phage integrase SAM-like domain-containing protein [Fibrella forsythiae]
MAASDDNGITPAFKNKGNFYEYFETYIKGYLKKDVRMFGDSLKYLKEYAQTDYLATKAVTEQFCKGFREFMDNHPNLNGETPYDFSAKFKKVIEQAVRDKLFIVSPA